MPVSVRNSISNCGYVVNAIAEYGAIRITAAVFPRHKPRAPVFLQIVTPDFSARCIENERLGSIWYRIFTRSKGAVTERATAPAVAPAAASTKSEGRRREGDIFVSFSFFLYFFVLCVHSDKLPTVVAPVARATLGVL
jgi:hypothetical protein